MSPKIIDREEKRRAIAHAAVIVFGEKGFDRTKMEDVAKAASVGKGTLYEYFKNKEELLQGAFKVLFEPMAAELVPEVAPGTPIAEMLRTATLQMAETLVHAGKTYTFFLEYVLHESRQDSNMQVMRDLLNLYRGALAALIREGQRRGELRSDVDPDRVAAFYAAWFDGIAFHWMVLPESTDIEALSLEFLETLLDGLHPRSEAD